MIVGLRARARARSHAGIEHEYHFIEHEHEHDNLKKLVVISGSVLITHRFSTPLRPVSMPSA
jgi:hypothetical protein